MAESELHFLLFSVFVVASTAINITEILSSFHEYSEFSKYLTQTKLDDDIDSRQTITCLVLKNDQVRELASKYPLSVMKNLLSLCVILDYYDSEKLHRGSVLVTTLYQTTGQGNGNFGSVNVTNQRGGKVTFSAAAPGAEQRSHFTKSVKQIPYNISVLEISEPIIDQAALTAPPPPAEVNITGLLEKAGCKTFASLIITSGVLKILQNHASTGLTIFAPSDEAFKATGAPDPTKLTSAELVALLENHAVSQYRPTGSLKIEKERLATFASSSRGKGGILATVSGDSITLHTAVASSRLATTVLDDPPLMIFTVDGILLTADLVSPSPAPAPAPETESDKVPVTSPLPHLAISPAKSPALMPSSPAATLGSPEISPDFGPSTSADVTSPSSSTKSSTFLTLAMAVCACIAGLAS